MGTTTTTPTTTIPVPKPPHDKGKGIMIEEPVVEQVKPMKRLEQMRLDEELAFKLQAEEEEERLSIEKLNKLKKPTYNEMVNTFVATELELVEESSKKAEAEIAQESSFPPRVGDKLEQENAKKQKVDEDKETAELQSLIKVVPDEEEVAIDVVPLATKPPTISALVKMLKSFNREDLEDLYKLVKAKYGSIRLVEDLDLILWGDLKIMFEPHVEDQVWKNQDNYSVFDWKLYDSCGVHSLKKKIVYIYMLVEKRYPLTPSTIIDMLNKKLQLMLLVYKLLLLVLKVNAASTKVTTAQRLRLLKEFLLSEKG
ncbi:hypothetical protein Tco_0601682 [Tanacetum coccineum]